MKLEIPGFGDINITELVFDYNGTLALDGNLLPGVKDNLKVFSNLYDIYVLTADTFGTVKKQLSGLNINIKIISKGGQEKEEFIINNSKENIIALGNGRNDALMLKKARIGVLIAGQEGYSANSLKNADIIFSNIDNFFSALNNPQRFKATLRD